MNNTTRALAAALATACILGLTATNASAAEERADLPTPGDLLNGLGLGGVADAVDNLLHSLLGSGGQGLSERS
ncbi:hypothetical protein ACIBQ5_07490 [Streptomyces massasporeus]|uniref:hypothetical protein n=1 Tax=Streptomyces TaxID=1883 RepID=UPI001610E1BA|nr:hypothetical protein [Streptomyces sp. AK010]MBB6415786.1 putative membrane protein [Streptomyces sp. AK010]